MSERRTRQDEGRSIFERLGGKDGDKGGDREERPRASARTEARRDQEQEGPIKSVEGWIIFLRNLNEEATEQDVLDKFAKFGPIKNVSLVLDRRTGYAKGYALVEYDKKEQAEKAIKDMNGETFLEKKISVAWGFAVEK